jgi:iron complex outermembrane receptor protein
MNTRHLAEPRRLVLSSVALAVLTLVNQANAQQADAPVARVEVTGSSIKRLAAEEALPITTIKAEELVKQGMTTLADVMMALPQSASLAPSNAGSGTNINLRGLGVNRTLVLLNGRRLANEAIADGYASLDYIPMSALSRVEVLRDGASSIYGSDAIGGVVNFITKPSYTGTSITAQVVRPERSGGGKEQRVSATWGMGDLAKDGWNFYATIDGHKRSRLLEKDRLDLAPSVDELTSIGRAPSLASGGYATPANYTTATNKVAANPYFATGCQAPYSILGGKSTCVLNNDEYGTALHANEQYTLYAKATKRINDDHTVTLDYSRGQASIYGAKNPTQVLAVGSNQPLLPSTSKWYPGNSGGVPAPAVSLKGVPLTVTWAVADAGAAITRDTQINQRLALSAEGRVSGWDYKTGLVYGLSQRNGYYESGYFDGQALINGLADGTLNPFGTQDQAGMDTLKKASVDGMHNRDSESKFAGVDATISRPLMQLAGGDMALALGADFHRDATRDDKLKQAEAVTYAKFVSSHGASSRTVTGLLAELDMPVTKELDLDAAVRADKYSDFGTTVNPKISFRYQPTKYLMFRGSANTGFRAPTLFDRYGYRSTTVANATTAAKWDDPVQCPGGTPGVAGTGKPLPGLVASTVCNANLNRMTGSNPNLTPEKSKGGTLGFVIEPTKSLTMSADYWMVNMTDMLANLPEQTYFLDYANYSKYFVRNADGSLAYIDNTTMNLGGQKAAGVDITANYEFPRTSYGTFKVGLDGTYLTRFDNQLQPGSAWVSNIGQFGLASNGTTSSLPIITYRWKHTLRMTWANGDWTSQLTQNHNSGYTDQNLVAQGYWRNIDTFSLWNLTVGYKGFPHTTIVAGVTNLFDMAPPTTNHSGYTFGYLSSAANITGRAYNLRATYDF